KRKRAPIYLFAKNKYIYRKKLSKGILILVQRNIKNPQQNTHSVSSVALREYLLPRRCFQWPPPVRGSPQSVGFSLCFWFLPIVAMPSIFPEAT
ncbi:unnamed protein product, partial [Citrullus colocynthis]